MTRIIYERSGGPTGKEIHFEQDLESLAGDEFHYQITVEDEDRNHTVRVSDSTMEKPLLPLIKELTLLKLFQ